MKEENLSQLKREMDGEIEKMENLSHRYGILQVFFRYAILALALVCTILTGLNVDSSLSPSVVTVALVSSVLIVLISATSNFMEPNRIRLMERLLQLYRLRLEIEQTENKEVVIDSEDWVNQVKNRYRKIVRQTLH